MDYNNNQNPGQWDRWNSNSSQNSYYNQPTHSPHKGRGFEYAAFICGLVSISFTCSGFFSLPVGALGILFALLTYRKGKKMQQLSKAGLWLSCTGILFTLILVVISFATITANMKDENFRNMINTMYEQILGVDFEEFMESAYGVSYEE